MSARDERKTKEGGNGPDAGGTRRGRGLILILVLAALGLGLSIELLRIHLIVVRDPHHDFACHVSPTMDCNAVAQSREALFLGVPTPAWGILTYLLVLGLAAARLLKKNRAGDYVLPISLWCVLYSAYLAYVSAFVLKIFCADCAGLYFVNLGLLLAAVQANSPLPEWLRRRFLDWQWLRARPVVMGVAGGIAVIAMFAGGVLYYRSNQPEALPLASGVKIDLSHDPMLGYFRAPVTIVEFSDFECPACRRMHGVVDELLQKYQGRIKVIHKNFPLNSECNPEVQTRMHQFACGAAAASECAYQRGKFEPYCRRLWEAKDLTMPALVKMAGEEGMDPQQFTACLASPETRKALLADTAAGAQIPVESTPTFIINGYKFEGYQNAKWCGNLIERFLRGEPPPAAVEVGEP